MNNELLLLLQMVYIQCAMDKVIDSQINITDSNFFPPLDHL